MTRFDLVSRSMIFQNWPVCYAHAVPKWLWYRFTHPEGTKDILVLTYKLESLFKGKKTHYSTSTKRCNFVNWKENVMWFGALYCWEDTAYIVTYAELWWKSSIDYLTLCCLHISYSSAWLETLSSVFLRYLHVYLLMWLWLNLAAYKCSHTW